MAGTRSPTSILITGASSGLGAALALGYARPGVRLALSGRNRARLETSARACLARGAEVDAQAIDVTDRAAMADWILRTDEACALELVIANAGISAGTGGGAESAEQTRAILATNIDGLMNTVLPALDRMRPRRRGQIALMSSLAAFRGFPGAPAYCASKAAVRVWGESLRGELIPFGIALSVICPGFVDTGMSAVNRFPMPFLMSAERAAGHIRRKLERGAARIAFPWPMTAAIWCLAALPPGLTDLLLARLPRKV
jgi:short-subunit dehydrogenase